MSVVGESAGFLSATFAAWVQAIGSIAAIYGAGFIADRQNRVEREREQRVRDETEVARRARISTLHRVAISTLRLGVVRLSALADALQEEQSAKIGNLAVGRLDTALDLVNKFDPFQLELPWSIYHYAQGQSILHDIVCHARNTERLSNDAQSQSLRARLIQGLSESMTSSVKSINDEILEIERSLAA